MKAPHSIFLLLLPLLILGGCASPTVVDYDHAALGKIKSYQCFVIDSRQERESYQDVALSPIVDRRIMRSLDHALKAKGFKEKCAKPDFRVTFHTSRKTKTEAHDLSVGPTPFGRHPYFGYSRYSHYTIDQYEEGTLVVDIIDHKSKQLVWRGAYSQRLGREALSDGQVDAIVSEILAHFPPGTAPKPD